MIKTGRPRKIIKIIRKKKKNGSDGTSETDTERRSSTTSLTTTTRSFETDDDNGNIIGDKSKSVGLIRVSSAGASLTKLRNTTANASGVSLQKKPPIAAETLKAKLLSKQKACDSYIDTTTTTTTTTTTSSDTSSSSGGKRMPPLSKVNGGGVKSTRVLTRTNSKQYDPSNIQKI